MKLRTALFAMALAVAGCERPAATESGGEDAGPQLSAPAPEGEPSRVFAAANDAARSATGRITVSIALQIPDSANADAREVLTVRAENNLTLEAQLSGAVSPATQVDGQTLRALLAIPVEAPQVLVYRVTEETRPSSGEGVCGGEQPDFVVLWEPSGPGEPVLKLLGLAGGSPGAAGARSCPMLEYRRA